MSKRIYVVGLILFLWSSVSIAVEDMLIGTWISTNLTDRIITVVFVQEGTASIDYKLNGKETSQTDGPYYWVVILQPDPIVVEFIAVNAADTVPGKRRRYELQFLTPDIVRLKQIYSHRDPATSIPSPTVLERQK